jgi:hypothetical protein
MLVCGLPLAVHSPVKHETIGVSGLDFGEARVSPVLLEHHHT